MTKERGGGGRRRGRVRGGGGESVTVLELNCLQTHYRRALSILQKCTATRFI